MHEVDCINGSSKETPASGVKFLSPLLYLTLGMLPFSVTQADLRDVPGLTTNQAALANAIQGSWDQVTGFAGFNNLEVDFVMSVNNLVVTSFCQQGNASCDTNVSLDLSEEEMRGALQDFAHQEVAISSNSVAKTSNDQFKSVQARSMVLRQPVMLGMSVREQDNDGIVNLHTLHGGNAGSELGNNWGAFVNGVISSGDKKATDNEEGYDFDTRGITAGVDYRFDEKFVLGLALGFSTAENDIDNDDGGVDTDGYSATLYSIYYQGDFYVDTALGYASLDYDITRRITYAAGAKKVDRTANGDTDGSQYTANIGGGYNAQFGRYTLGPFLRLNYVDAEVDKYDETGDDIAGLALSVEDQSFESLQSALGINTSIAISTTKGVIIPHLKAEWLHEFENDSRSVNAGFINDPFNALFAVVTDDPDRDFMKAGLGLSFVTNLDAQFFLDIESVYGLRDVDNTVYTIGGRFEF